MKTISKYFTVNTAITLAVVFIVAILVYKVSKVDFGALLFGGGGDAPPLEPSQAPSALQEQKESGGQPTDRLPKSGTYYQSVASEFLEIVDGLNIFKVPMTLNSFAKKLLEHNDDELEAINFIVYSRSTFTIVQWLESEYFVFDSIIASFKNRLGG